MNAKAKIDTHLVSLESILKIGVLAASAVLSALEIKKTVEAIRVKS